MYTCALFVFGTVALARHSASSMVERNKVVAEGAGACPLAAAMMGRAGKGKVVCVVSGGGLDTAKLVQILAGCPNSASNPKPTSSECPRRKMNTWCRDGIWTVGGLATPLSLSGLAVAAITTCVAAPLLTAGTSTSSMVDKANSKATSVGLFCAGAIFGLGLDHCLRKLGR